MAPMLVEKKEEGVGISQLVEELANDGFVISAPTLSRYLNQYQNCQKANNKSDNYSEAEKPAASGTSVEKSENSAANDIVSHSSQPLTNVLLHEAKSHTPNA